MLNLTALALITGFIADLLIGDPAWLYHPVRIIGNSISLFEKAMRRIFPATPAGEKTGGFLTVLLILAECALIPSVILIILWKLGPAAFFAGEAFMCYQMLAVRSLKDESMKVFTKLREGDLEGARYAVSMIVGRDTQNLSEEAVAKAAVETVAENGSDGIIAPMFYFIIGGPVLMWIYKGINTMDSMLGYKNDKYINFGRYAAKLDDIANFIPARLSGILMILGSFFAGYDYKEAKRIFLRDRFNHASPNSAQTESVMAGALNLQLAGDACYFGEIYRKPTIGDFTKHTEAEDIKKANRLLYITAALTVIIFAAVRIAVML